MGGRRLPRRNPDDTLICGHHGWPALMKVNTRTLRSHPLLSLLPLSTLRALSSDSAVREYPKGTVVFREGAPCDAIYLVISGRCEAAHHNGSGESVVEEVFGP